jgi:hypothetical protein
MDRIQSTAGDAAGQTILATIQQVRPAVCPVLFCCHYCIFRIFFSSFFSFDTTVRILTVVPVYESRVNSLVLESRKKRAAAAEQRLLGAVKKSGFFPSPEVVGCVRVCVGKFQRLSKKFHHVREMYAPGCCAVATLLAESLGLLQWKSVE